MTTLSSNEWKIGDWFLIWCGGLAVALAGSDVLAAMYAAGSRMDTLREYLAPILLVSNSAAILVSLCSLAVVGALATRAAWRCFRKWMSA